MRECKKYIVNIAQQNKWLEILILKKISLNQSVLYM